MPEMSKMSPASSSHHQYPIFCLSTLTRPLVSLHLPPRPGLDDNPTFGPISILCSPSHTVTDLVMIASQHVWISHQVIKLYEVAHCVQLSHHYATSNNAWAIVGIGRHLLDECMNEEIYRTDAEWVGIFQFPSKSSKRKFFFLMNRMG